MASTDSFTGSSTSSPINYQGFPAASTAPWIENLNKQEDGNGHTLDDNNLIKSVNAIDTFIIQHMKM